MNRGKKKQKKSHIKLLGLYTSLHSLLRTLLTLQTHHIHFPCVTKFNLSVRKIWTVEAKDVLVSRAHLLDHL